jgi:hypothetical protein
VNAVSKFLILRIRCGSILYGLGILCPSGVVLMVDGGMGFLQRHNLPSLRCNRLAHGS